MVLITNHKKYYTINIWLNLAIIIDSLKNKIDIFFRTDEPDLATSHLDNRATRCNIYVLLQRTHIFASWEVSRRV